MSTALTIGPMTREAFHAWRDQQPGGRFERLDGYVYAMAPERLGHALMKALVWKALREAIEHAGVPCQAVPDGVTLQTESNDFEPDAMVRCGARLPSETIRVLDPVVVVEVLSPGTRGVDTGAKLAAYFSLPTVAHYLIIDPDTPAVIHHRRDTPDLIQTRIAASGLVRLDPPGITLDVGALYEAALA